MTGIKKKCYNCHLEKPRSEMQEMGVWVCNQCFEKFSAPVKKPVKTKSE